MKNLKNLYLLTLLISTLSASGFTTNSISPGDTLIISSNAIPVGSFIDGIELYFDNTNTIAKGQNGYYLDYDDYAITNNAIVLEDWYLQMDLASFPPVYNVGPAELYPAISLGPVIASFSMDKVTSSNGFNMELNPYWSSTNLTFSSSDRFLTSTTPPVFSDNIYFNDFDEDNEAGLDYYSIIPARGSSVEFGMFSEPGPIASNYNYLVETDFNFVLADTPGMVNWEDDFEVVVQLESSDNAGEPTQKVGINFEYINNGEYTWIDGDIDNNDLGLSLADLSAADFKFYSSNSWYYVDFLPVGMSNQTHFINLISWGSSDNEHITVRTIEDVNDEEEYTGSGATNLINGYLYVDTLLTNMPPTQSYYGLSIDASNEDEFLAPNSLGVSYFNVSRDPSSPITVTNDYGVSFSFPEGYYEKGNNSLWSDDLSLVEYDEGIVIEGAHGIMFSPGETYISSSNNMQVTSGALAAGSLTAADDVLSNLLSEYSLVISDNYNDVSVSASETVYQDGLLVKEAAVDYTLGEVSYTGSVVAVLSTTNVTVYETWANEDVSASTRDALFSAVSSPSATPAAYVYRLPDPTSLSAVSLDWELELSSLPNYPTNGSLEVGTGVPFNDSVDFYPLEDEKLFCTYPYQGVSDERNYGYSLSNLTTVITVISPDGSVAYSDTESYVPFIASGMSKEIISILPRNLGNGMFMIHRNFEGQGNMELGYTNVYHTTSALYYPTNGTYEKIYFDGMETKIYDNEGIYLSESDLRNSWEVHQNKIYFKSNNSTQLRKYSINLPHLNVIDVSDPSAALLALDARLDSVETNLTKVSSNMAISNSALIGAFAASDASVSNAVISYADSAINAFSNSVDWASIGSSGSDPALSSRVSDVESVNALLANSINLEISQRQAAVSALQNDIIDLQTAMVTMTNNSAGMTIAEAKEMMKDLRPGSTIIDVEDGQATISMHLEESSDLTTNWTERADTLMEVTVPATNDIRFFRFGN